VSDPHSSDYPETPLGVHRCECGAWVYSNELDGRCDRCSQPEPQEHSAALLREWAAILSDVIELNRDEHPERVAPLEAKCQAWLREADEIERRVA
jgi:hypothetical protein